MTDTTPELIPFFPAKDFVVVRPAKPKTREGSIALPQASAAKPWHGELVIDEDGRTKSADFDSMIVWYSRSFPMEPIRMARNDGTWEEVDLIVLHKQALRGSWRCTRAQADALMNPDAEPVDPKLERELVKVREAQT